MTIKPPISRALIASARCKTGTRYEVSGKLFASVTFASVIFALSLLRDVTIIAVTMVSAYFARLLNGCRAVERARARAMMRLICF